MGGREEGSTKEEKGAKEVGPAEKTLAVGLGPGGLRDLTAVGCMVE